MGRPRKEDANKNRTSAGKVASKRARKYSGGAFPADEVDKILVFGEVLPSPDTGHLVTRYPSYRELAERFECSDSSIAVFSKTRNCLARREEAAARISVQRDQRLIEARARILVRAVEDEVRTIDAFCAEFEKRVLNGGVRIDSMADFNTALRLKAFIMGDADSRQEVNHSLSLEVLQERHSTMRRAMSVVPPALLGYGDRNVIVDGSDASDEEDDPDGVFARGELGPAIPPAPSTEEDNS